MRLITIALLLTLASCRGFSGIPTNLIDDPEVFYLPVGEFAYCAGQAIDALPCQCIDSQLPHDVLESPSRYTNSNTSD